LTYKHHFERTSKKIHTRNELFQKLTESKWGAQPHALQMSVIAFCFSVEEYACEMWGNLAHVKEIDTTINDACRIVTGCLKNT